MQEVQYVTCPCMLNEWFDVECVIDIACCDALYYINNKMYFYEREFFEV